jgi:argininosuccinate lyase
VSDAGGDQGAQMWGGRFVGRLDPGFAQFQQSLPIDYVLAFADLEVNRAWATALAAAGVFTTEELQRVQDGIEDLAEHWLEHGVPADDDAEDVHSLVERELVDRCGDLGKRLHTGRSRNDQVATDLRLHLRECIHDCLDGLRRLCTSLVEKAESH